MLVNKINLQESSLLVQQHPSNCAELFEEPFGDDEEEDDEEEDEPANGPVWGDSPPWEPGSNEDGMMTNQMMNLKFTLACNQCT